MSLVKINKQQVELTPIDKNYTSQSEMIEDQLNQFVDFIYSDGENFWQYLGTINGDITDYRSLGGASESAVSVSGYNYIICETVNTEDPVADALANGTNLITKYAEAVALNIGTPSINNRAVLLLMPGDYDLGGTTLELEPFVDVIGISTNAADTIIRMSNASAGQLTIDWQDSDAMVSNVDIRADVANDGIAIGGGDSSYVKLENVIFGSDNPTSNSDGSIKGFNDFNGELNRIRFSELLITDFLWVEGNINGTFKDIVINDVTNNAFYAGITNFYGNIEGVFENIKIGDVGNYAFYAENDINGTFKDIVIGDVANAVFSATGNINGTFKDIVIGDVIDTAFGGVFSATSGSIGDDIDVFTIFENIRIGDVANDSFVAINSIDGIFKNIIIGDVGNYAFRSGGNIGNNEDVFTIFENIRIGDVGNDSFNAGWFNTFTNLKGTFKDIIVGDVTGNIFYSNSTANGDINGTFKDIVIGNVTQNAFYANNSIGFDSVNSVVTDTIFENIVIGNVTNTVFFAGADMNGTFKDIVVGNVNAAFIAGNNMGFDSFNSVATDTIFENIVIGDVTNTVFFAVADINGTFKDIVIGDVVDAFSAFTDINGTFKNIVIGNVTNDAFYAGNNIGFDTIFENIRIGNVTNNAFSAFTDINGTFKNIVIGNVTNDAFYAGNSIGFDSFNSVVTDTIFENIVIGDVSNYAFYADFNDMNGTFKDIVIGDVSYAFYAINNIGFDSVNNVVTDTIFENITIGDVVGDVFYAVNSDINGTFKNIAIGNVTINAFNAVNSIGFDSVNSVTTDTIFENIVIGDVGSNVFYAVSGDINGTFKNIVVGNVTTYAFYAPSSNDYSNCTFININCAQAFQQDTFNGKIYNTTIDATGLAIDGIRDLASGAIIERCKFIVDSGNVSINTQDILGVTAQILYTITNYGISTDITVPTFNYNIDDTSIV
jgi:hypothetical protein